MEDDSLQSIFHLAQKNPKRIILPESGDERILTAATKIAEQKLAYPVLLGDPDKILHQAKILGLNFNQVEIINAHHSSTNVDLQKILTNIYIKKNKPLTAEQIENSMADPLFLSTLLIKSHQVDGCLAGAVNTTAKVLKAAFSILGASQGVSCISSAMIMAWADQSKRTMIFSDCAVNIEPDAEQLADIAIASAENAKTLLNLTPKVAMLSFSTHGSAEHELSLRVAEATKIAKAKRPDLEIDGELQLDAAIHPPTAEKKAPSSPLKGEANVLIFPNFKAGNIGYKLVQRLGGASAIGPILQGIAHPMNDLSRGASIDDIVNMCAITSLQASHR